MKFDSYKSAGVDIDTAGKAKSSIAKLAKKTFSSSVLTDIGSFGALFKIPKSKRELVFVSSVDGVGTKLKIASLMNKHDTVGIDIVNHCANDILAAGGARPLFFLDYIAMGKMKAEVVEDIVKGLVFACKKLGCSLIGGETAEMPDMYKPNEYDLAGFIVGVVERNKIINGKTVQEGDCIIGLASSGMHTNGYSLARKLLFKQKRYYAVSKYIPSLKTTIGKELLKPHRAYGNIMFKLMERFNIKAMAHITGGGFLDNIPRVLPAGNLSRQESNAGQINNLCAVINKNSWEILPVFKLLQKLGDLADMEMFRTFNMGIGFVLIVPQTQAKGIMNFLTNKKRKSLAYRKD